eukprot:tig00000514_g1792.t1
MEWAPASLELGLDFENDNACDTLVSLIEEGKLRLGSGASVSIRLKYATDCTVEDICSLLAAISHPRKVDIELLSGSLDVDDDIDEDFLRDLVLGVLRALQPKEGAAGRLENLSFCLDPSSYEGEWTNWPSASADELREALAPFGALRSLGIFFEQVGAAAVIVAACPNLRSIRLQAKSSDGPDETGEDWDELQYGGSDILAALAPLACLEHVTLEYPDRDIDDVDANTDTRIPNEGLRELARGPAGRTLKSIHFAKEAWLIDCDAAFAGSTHFRLQLYRPLSEAEAEAIVSLPGLTHLEIVILSDREPQRVLPYQV